jgi:hypothetical protein
VVFSLLSHCIFNAKLECAGCTRLNHSIPLGFKGEISCSRGV